jgi:hypothetical protein
MTIRVSIGEAVVPLLPDEKDESIDLSDVKPRKIIKRAAADLANGLQDTGRSAQMDLTYKKLKSKDAPKK